MRTERGIADGWLILIGLIVLVGMVTAAYQAVDHRGYVRGKAEVQAKFDKFVTDTAKAGAAADAAKKLHEAEDKRKEAANNAENQDLRRELDLRRSQLRDSRKGPGGSIVPGPKPGARSPDEITFNRAELDRALRDFTAGTEELVGEGAEAVIDLDSGKKWIKDR